MNARAFVRERMPQLPEGPVGLIAGTVLGGLRHLTRAAHRRYRLVPVEQFDTRADHVWSSCAPHWPVIACRDGEWLRWRWGACPRARPNALWLEKDGETVGWAVLGRREHGSLNAGFIVDLLCEPRDLSALLSLAVDHFYRAGVDAVYCLFQAPGVDATLASCGFLRRDSGFAMMVYSDKLPAEVRNTLADASQWFVTSGDSNLERPRENTQYA